MDVHARLHDEIWRGAREPGAPLDIDSIADGFGAAPDAVAHALGKLVDEGLAVEIAGRHAVARPSLADVEASIAGIQFVVWVMLELKLHPPNAGRLRASAKALADAAPEQLPDALDEALFTLAFEWTSESLLGLLGRVVRTLRLALPRSHVSRLRPVAAAWGDLIDAIVSDDSPRVVEALRELAVRMTKAYGPYS